MKNITKLTKEQESRFGEWKDRWISIGLSTERADWTRFEKAARCCYSIAKLNPDVPIVHVSSPIVGAFAAPIADSLIRIIKKVKDVDAVRGAVGGAVADAVRGAVGDAVDDVVRGAVDDAVRDAVAGAVGGAVADAVAGAVTGAVADAVRGAVDDVVEGAVADAVDDAVDGAVGGAVGDAVRDAVGGAVGDAVGDAVEGAVRGAVGGAVDDAVDGAVGGAVRDAMGGAVKKQKGKLIFWHYWMGGSFWCWWTAFESFFREICSLDLGEDINNRAFQYAETVQSANYWWPNREFMMVCDRPVHIDRNLRGRLHSEKRMAIQWPDGWGIYMLNGIRMKESDVMTPAEKIDPHEVMKRENVDERRELIRKVGIERMLSAMKSKTIDTQGDYALLEIELSPVIKNARYLKMKNPSIGIWHLEGVARECNTVQQAINWRAGDIHTNWEPAKLT